MYESSSHFHIPFFANLGGVRIMLMLCLASFAQFVAFPQKEDAILKNAIDSKEGIQISASGSLGIYIDRKCRITNPNYTIIEDKKLDWCSNLIKDKSTGDKPWITYSLKNKKMRLTSYSLRTGCCWYACCCVDDNTFINDGYACCCDLYSFSLYGSNDNHTWVLLHRIEKQPDFDYCETRTYEISKNEFFKYIKLVQDEERPSCPFCMQINQIEFYGQTTTSIDEYIFNENDDEESISIIGKVRKDA